LGVPWFDVLIVGGGFGGASCARRLERRLAARPARVLLVAPENFLLFSPLLPEAASGTLEPRHAVVPLRQMLPSTVIVTGRIERLDVAARRAVVVDTTGHRQDVSYRILVLSPGSVPTVAPVPGLAEEAVGFKTLADAIWLRNRVLSQMEAAASAVDQNERRKLLTFTFVGGGYAGVEALAELESLSRDALRAYPSLGPAEFRWVLVEAADRLLPALDPKLASHTLKVLLARRIEVHLKTKMTSCVGRRVTLSDPTIDAFDSATIVWTAGQRPSPMVADLGLALDDRGRVVVDEQLRPAGHDHVFVVGDAAAVPDPSHAGDVCPPTAQHALRQGYAAADNVAAVLGVGEPRAFSYRTRGLAVTLGRNQGTAQVYRWHVKGFLAWWMGRAYHLVMLPGNGRKARILTDWTLSELFPRDIAQLGSLGKPSPLA
jgi:NADH dehydrogenase